jgi:hypothetical protein
MFGSPTGARQFAAFLRTKFPTLYVEDSTGGKGQHGYLLVRKLGYSAEEVKAALKHLEKWLRQQAKGFDIEIVEVKGTPPVVKYRDGGFIECVTYGLFGKLPRDVSRFAEWTSTTTLMVPELLTLLLVEEVAVSGEPKMPKQSVKPAAGSVSGKNINPEELDLMPTWERLFRRLRKDKALYGARWLVTDTDFAQAIVLLRFFTEAENRNPDGSLPQCRAQELRTALYDAGDFERPWNHHRWKAIRDWMSQRGWLDWQDNRYQIGTGRGDGVACKWALHPDFAQELDALALCQGQAAASFADTGEIQRGRGEPLKPVRYHWFKQVERALLWLEVEKVIKKPWAA